MIKVSSRWFLLPSTCDDQAVSSLLNREAKPIRTEGPCIFCKNKIQYIHTAITNTTARECPRYSKRYASPFVRKKPAPRDHSASASISSSSTANSSSSSSSFAFVAAFCLAAPRVLVAVPPPAASVRRFLGLNSDYMDE